MKIEVDFEASRKVADDVEDELRRLKAEFEACDRVVYATSVAVRAQSGAVADSVADVAAREGAHRTKAHAEAQDAVTSLRTALGWLERSTDDIVNDAKALGEHLQNVGEQVVGGVKHFADGVVDGVQDAGRAVVDKVQDTGESIKDGVEDIWHDLTGGASKGISHVDRP